MKFDQKILVPVILMALAGCQSVGFGRTAKPLTPVPTTPVATAALPPVSSPSPTTNDAQLRGSQDAEDKVDEAKDESVEVAKAEIKPPEGGGQSFTKADMSGGWTLSSGGSNCQLIMSQTSWTGGQRAITRGCSGEPLNKVSAWQLNGKQLVLVADGAPVARLYKTGDTQFNGQIETGGRAVSVFR